MEFVKSYWWIFAGVLVLLLLSSRQSAGAGVTVTQIGGSDSGLGLAQLDAQTQLADQSARYGLISSLLNWDLSRLQLDTNERIAYESLESSERIAAAQSAAGLQSAAYGYQAQQAAANAQLQAQLAAIAAANKANSRNAWASFGAGALQGFMPLFSNLFGGGSGGSGGGWSLGSGAIGGGFGGSSGWGLY